jgi:WD40 repeat protein
LSGSGGFGRSFRFSPLGASVLPRTDVGTVSTAAAVGPDGRLLATSPAAGQVVLSDARSSRPVATLTGPVGFVEALAFSRDGTLVAAAGRASSVIWDVARHTIRQQLPYANRANSLTFSPRRDLLAIGLDSATIVLVDPTSGRRLASLPSNLGSIPTELSFSPDGSRLAVAGVGGVVQIVDVRSETPLLSFQDRGITYATRFAPHGHLLATGDDSGAVFLWDERTGRPVGPPLSAHSAVLRLAFSPDGTILATSNADGKLRLWDLASRRLIGAPLDGGGGTTLFLPDGSTLVGVARDGTGMAWPVDAAAWKAQACRVARRDLTPDEWQTYLPARPYRSVCGA